MAEQNNWNAKQVLTTWRIIEPIVRRFNRAKSGDEKKEILGIKGESVSVDLGNGRSEYRWSRGSCTGNCYCVSGC